jgi:hypothetical protein
MNNMEHKIIHTQNYLLIVDESETKVHGYKYCDDGENIKNVIAHLPLNNSPILEGVPLLPPLEDDVDKLARQFAIDESYGKISGDLFKGFIFGYNKAKEKYKYTDEDMINAILFGMQKGLNVGKVDETDSDWVNNYVKSLQQPKIPVGFKCEVQILRERPTDIRNHVYDKTYEVPKTTTNSQGLTQWIGEYIYD